jgi:hypothetical protein
LGDGGDDSRGRLASRGEDEDPKGTREDGAGNAMGAEVVGAVPEGTTRVVEVDETVTSGGAYSVAAEETVPEGTPKAVEGDSTIRDGGADRVPVVRVLPEEGTTTVEGDGTPEVFPERNEREPGARGAPASREEAIMDAPEGSVRRALFGPNRPGPSPMQ